MIINNFKKNNNQFIIKSNIIIKALKIPNWTIMTIRLFLFGLAKLSNNQYQIKNNYVEYNISLIEFSKYYKIGLNQLYDFVIIKGKKITLIKKEMKIISFSQIEIKYPNEPFNFDLQNLFLDCGHRKNTGKVYFQMRKDLFNKYFINQIKNFSKFYLPYTKFITTKYTWLLYEYLRSHLYINLKTLKLVFFEHLIMNFKDLAIILNIEWDSFYLKEIRKLKKYILEPIKKDLLNTDLIINYKILKTGKKNTHIKFYTKINIKKFILQQKEAYGVNSKNYIYFQNNYNKLKY